MSEMYARELLCSRLLSGFTPVRLPHRFLLVREPDSYSRLVASERAALAASKAKKKGLLTQDETVERLKSRGLWSEAEEASLTKYNRDIEDFKIALYKAGFRKQQRELIRKNLRKAEEERDNLSSKKYRLTSTTIEGHANTIKMKCLIGMNTLKRNKEPLWGETSFWRDRTSLLDDVILAYLSCKPNESDVRELARSEPWRSTWAAREVGSVFGRCAGDLGDDQRALVAWTRTYDNAREHPEGPGEWAIEDDDAFDGWLLSIRKDTKDKSVDASITSEKIMKAENIFVIANTQDEIESVEAMNDAAARAKKSAIFSKIDGGKMVEASEKVKR